MEWISAQDSFAAFCGTEQIGRGVLEEVVLQAKARLDAGERARIAIYHDESGATVDVDFRGSADEVRARLAEHPLVARSATPPAERRGPGRPRLGVVSREVSLLPRHWDWLGAQRGGASAALRRLVDEARRLGQGRERARRAREAAHRFLWDMAGDFPYFEEVCRALDARDYARLDRLVDEWPRDVRQHVRRLADRAAQLEQEAAPS